MKRTPKYLRRQVRFPGPLEQLQGIVHLSEVVGDWQFMPVGYWRFLCRDGAILNWWPSTGTINFQGPLAERQAFELALMEVASRLRLQRPALLKLSSR
jgi:hypothetical protein